MSHELSRSAVISAAAVVTVGVVVVSGAALVMSEAVSARRRKRGRVEQAQHLVSCYRCGGCESLIGNTPLVKLERLSALLKGASVCVKMECMNPGGTGKDRAALFMLRDAERRGLLPPPLAASEFRDDEGSVGRLGVEEIQQAAVRRTRTGGIVVEGTSGSTGISLATLCAPRGHSVIIVMPDDQAEEKQTILRSLGALVHVVPNVAFSHPDHYVNAARRIADDINAHHRSIKALFIDQFENRANYDAHYTTTGPEILKQTAPNTINAFVMSSGTGGTISGVGRYLKDQHSPIKVVLVDPPGSALYNKVKYNVAYATQQSERSLRRHRYDTLAEGIGLDRITHNFALGDIDDAVRVTDQEAVDMAHWLLREEGLFVGSSSAMNVAGAIRVATTAIMTQQHSTRLSNNGGHQPQNDDDEYLVVTVICDGGQRHLTRFWNRPFIIQWGLKWPPDDECAWRERLPPCLSFNKKTPLP